MYSGVGDGFAKIKAAEGFKGFTLVSTLNQILICVAFRDGLQPFSDTPLKVSESSDSMRSSRMFTELPPVTTLPSTKLLDLLSPPHALRSSPIVSSALGKQ